MNTEKENQDNFERHKIEIPEIEKKLGDAKRQSKNYDDALYHYKNSLLAIKLLFDEEGLVDEEKASNLIEKIAIPVHLNMAFCYLEKKDWENVITYCNKVLEIKKDDTKAIYRRCKAYIEMGIKAIDNAEQDFEYLNSLMRQNEKPEVPLKEQDLSLLKDLEKQLDRLRLEREANNIFGSMPDSNILDEYLKKEESDKEMSKNNLEKPEEHRAIRFRKERDYENKNNNLDAEKHEIKSTKSNQEIIQDKIDYLFNSEILNRCQKGFIDNITDWDLKEKIAIFFSSNLFNASKIDELKDYYRLKFNNYIEEIENKYLPKEGKFRYALDSTINIAKKLKPHTDPIKDKCLGSIKKCCYFPINLAKKQIEIIYGILCFFMLLIKDKILNNKDPKSAKDIAYLKSE